MGEFGWMQDCYFGVDTLCEQEYSQNTVKLTYIGNADANEDPYRGLDRGACPVLAGRRVIDQRWYKGSTDLERLDYTYSRLGNRTERKNTVGADQDEKYAYDDLYRLDDMERGTLDNGSIIDKKFAQDWGYDALGNWDTFKQDDDGTGWNLNQTRAHTKANEIEEIDADSSVISHDPAGNITKSPQPRNWGGTYDYVWDAWNRLVKVVQSGRTQGLYRYSGEHKRITKTASGITRHFYYSVDWQILEERLDEETEPARQYVWNPNPGRMDDLILRDESFDGSGSSSSSSSGGQQRLYALNDLMNVTAIVDDDGNVVERYGYTPFGGSRVMDAGFGPRSSSDYDWELRYKTYLLDLESGLYQVRYRYLHPALGRWLNRDPIGYRGGVNLYAFVGNDPVNHSDSIGLIVGNPITVSPPPGVDYSDSGDNVSLPGIDDIQFTQAEEVKGKGCTKLPWPSTFMCAGGSVTIEKGRCCEDDTEREFVELSGSLFIEAGAKVEFTRDKDKPISFEVEAGGDVKTVSDCPSESSATLSATFGISVHGSPGYGEFGGGCSKTWRFKEGWDSWSCRGTGRLGFHEPGVTAKGSFSVALSGVIAFLD